MYIYQWKRIINSLLLFKHEFGKYDILEGMHADTHSVCLSDFCQRIYN